MKKIKSWCITTSDVVLTFAMLIGFAVLVDYLFVYLFFYLSERLYWAILLR